MRIRISDARAVLNLSSNSKLSEKLPPNPATGKAYNKSQITRWNGVLPELQSRQLVEQYPALRDHIIDPETGLTPVEMRSLVKGGD